MSSGRAARTLLAVAAPAWFPAAWHRVP